MITHQPLRPDWTCADCAAPWPCGSRQRQLLTEFAGCRISLALYLGEYFLAAVDDLPAGTPGLYTRFLGWIRQARPL